MKQVNVVVTHKLEEEYFKQITAVSPAIKLFDASAFYYAESHGDSTSKDKFNAMLARAEVICGFWPPANLISRAPNLKWLHTMVAGLDRPEYIDILRSRVIITNSTGIHGTQISELVFTLMLMLAKRAQFCFRLQQEKKWDQFVPMLLHGKTLGIVGLGASAKKWHD